MKPPTKPRAPKTVQDLMLVTGWGEYAVRKGIREGTLPGYHSGRQYTVPADAFDAFCLGQWIAQPKVVIHEFKPISEEPTPIRKAV